MEIFNQPPETDIPLALAEVKADEDSVVMHADLSDTKAVKKSEETEPEERRSLDTPKKQKRPEIKFLQFIDFENLPTKRK